MKELPQHSLVPESFPKKAARFVLEKATPIILPVSALIAVAFGAGVGEENTNGIINDLPKNQNNAVVAGPNDSILPIPGSVKETPKSISPAQLEGKISISKKPEDLHHALTLAPLLKKDLPPGMSVIGNPTAYSPSEIHNNIAKSYGDPLQPFSGVVNIRIDDERLNPLKAQGFPNIILILNVFASNQDAQAAYNKSATNKSTTQNEQTLPIENFPYAAVIQRSTYSTVSGIAHIENVAVQLKMHGNDMKIVEQRAIELMLSIPKLLQDAGN